MPTFEIYTTGGAWYLTAVFNFLAAFTGAADFRLFLSIGLSVGAIGLMWRMIWGAGLKDVLQQVVLMLLVGLGGVGVKARVVIIDPTAGTIPIYATVDNVPWSIALLGHFTSGISYELTARMETLLSTPDNLSYQKSGMLFGATLLSQASRWRAVSPQIHELIVNYMQNCVIDGTMLGHMDLEEVSGSGSLDAEITDHVPQSLAYYDTVTGQTEGCAARWSAVRGLIGQEVEKVLTVKAAGAWPDGHGTGASNVAKLKGTLADFQTMIGMSSASAVATVRQAMLLTAMDDAVNRFIATSGNDAAMALYQTARTDVQTRASYSAIGASALKWVPLLKIVLETVYYACFPLALFMMVALPGGWSVLKGYAGGFVWLAAWGPISAILHMIVLEAASGYYRSAGLTTTDGTVNDVVLSLSNLYQMQAVEADVGSIAGYLMMSVPFLATAILFGADKMTSMATSLLNVGQGAAIETGREAATGAISLGNVSMNNMAANKWNTSGLRDEGRFTGVAGNGAMVTRNPDGLVTYGRGSAITETAFNGSLSNSVRAEMSARVDETRTTAATKTAELSSFMAGATANTMGFVNSVLASKGSSQGGTVETGGSHSTSVADAWQTVKDFAKANNVTDEVALSAVMGATLGLDAGAKLGSPGEELLGSGISGSAKGGVSGDTSLRAGAQNSDFLGLTEKAVADKRLMSAFDTIDSARESSGWTANSSETQSSDQSQRYSLDEGQRMARAALRSISEAETAAKGQAYVEAHGLTGDVNINNQVASKVRDLGGDPLNVMFSSDAADIALVDRAVKLVAKDLTNPATFAEPAPKQPGFQVEDPTVTQSFAPPQQTSAQVGATTVDRAALTTSAQTSFETNQAESGSRINDLDNTSMSTEARSGFTTLAAGITESADSSMAGRLAGKVVQSTSEILGISESEAATRLQSDPLLSYDPKAAQITAAPDALTATTSTAPSEGDAPKDQPPAPTTPMVPISTTPEDRDAMVRTIIGEAAGEGPEGMAAVALVIRNRMADNRYPDTAGAVVLQPGQFSAWNTDGSGNELVHQYGPGSQVYDRAALIADMVMGGQVTDFTKGAVNYYSPEGMRALVAQGYQDNLIPGWLANANAERSGPAVQVGNQVFTGEVKQ